MTIEERLRERRRVLREEIRQTLLRADQERLVDISGPVQESGDDAFAGLLAGVSNADVVRDIGEVREIDVALERIASGTYGACMDCDARIPESRLEAQPAAVRCLPCQAAYEKRRSNG